MQFLPEAYASLVDQAMPPGWTWQWLIQEDGSTGAARLQVPADDDRVSCGTGRPLGPAIARTLAISRATGELIKVLDSDDVLAPGALARDIQRYLADEAVEARPASAGYRFGKFLKRNKGPVIAVSVILLCLVAGIIGTSAGLTWAVRERNDKARALIAEPMAHEAETKARDHTRHALFVGPDSSVSSDATLDR